MQKNKYLKAVILAYIILSSFGSLYSQPNITDYVLGYGGLAVIVSSELLLKETFSPAEPKWVQPNSFDLFFRDNLKWGNKRINSAAIASDVLLKGLFIPSVLWTPLLTDYKFDHYLLLNFQVFAATGLLTNIAKFSFGRQRPYSFYITKDSNGVDDYLSFFSGHTSLSFAMATSTAYILEKENPHSSGMIWCTFLALASATGYLRIAADRHYMSDVLTGAIVGGLTGYLISKEQSKRFFKKKRLKQETGMLFYFSLPL